MRGTSRKEALLWYFHLESNNIKKFGQSRGFVNLGGFQNGVHYNENVGGVSY